jgi:hypothetical protein
MASSRWPSNAVKASIVTAVIGAVGKVAAAYVAKSCPVTPAPDRCAELLTYAGSFQGKPLSPKLQAEVDRCTGTAS